MFLKIKEEVNVVEKNNSGSIVKVNNVKNLVFSALCCAMTAIFAMFTVPIGPIPITLANLAIYISGAILGPLYGAISQVLYLALVFIGVPCTSQFKGGPAYLTGATAGYMYGYILIAFFVGLIYKKFAKSSQSYVMKTLFLIGGCVIGTAACYFLGTVWYVFYANISFSKAFSVCVAPFLIGDSIKILIASLVVPRVERVINL